MGGEGHVSAEAAVVRPARLMLVAQLAKLDEDAGGGTQNAALGVGEPERGRHRLSEESAGVGLHPSHLSFSTFRTSRWRCLIASDSMLSPQSSSEASTWAIVSCQSSGSPP